MNWIHRIAGTSNSYARHFPALWHLLTEKNCLTIGWQCLIGDSSVVNAVHAHDYAQVKKAVMAAAGVSEQATRGLANFSTFAAGDVVVVLPIRNRKEIFFVKVKTPAQSILNVPPAMQAPFTISGSTITFNATDGFVYPGGSAVDAGFFCEVDILAHVPWDNLTPSFDNDCKFQGTNAKL